jgi:copper(I)-binding protein
MTKAFRLMLALAVVVSIAAVACSSDEGSSDEGSSTSSSSVSVTDPWGWSSTPDRAAVYFTVENTGDQAVRIVGASSDVAGTVQVHETTMVDGTASMQEVDGVDVPAGGGVTFEPGGYHVMMMDIPEPLEVGSAIDVTLTFADGFETLISAEIREFTGEPMQDAGGM